MQSKIKIADDGKIFNLDEMILFISNLNDINYLNDLLLAIEEYQSQNENFLSLDFIALKKEINKRLKSLGYIKGKTINFDIYALMRKLNDKIYLSASEQEALTVKMQELLEKMNNKIEANEQNLLDVFVDTIKDNEHIPDKWKEIVYKYYKIVDENTKKRLLEESKAKQDEHRVLKLERLQKNTEGKVLTISILEITIIIGTIIAFLMIALI